MNDAIGILGWGTALPEHSIEQGAAAAFAAEITAMNAGAQRMLPILYRKAGVRRRHSVLLEDGNGHGPRQSFFAPPREEGDRGPGTAARMERYRETAPALAVRAGAAALGEGRVPASQITHLVTVSCTGFTAPGFDLALVRELGLPATVARTHVGFMGCHGALNGLRVARAAASEPGARILLVAVELCSLHFQYGWDEGRVVANALFADGAAAAVVGSLGPGPQSARGVWRLAANGAVLIPESDDAMSWNVGDNGFEMTLSPRVPDLIARHLKPWLETWLAGAGVPLESVASWAVHPGGPRILTAVEQALALPPAALAEARAVLAEHGNMSSPTVLFILRRLVAAGAPRPAVALGFGPGLAAEAALFV